MVLVLFIDVHHHPRIFMGIFVSVSATQSVKISQIHYFFCSRLVFTLRARKEIMFRKLKMSPKYKLTPKQKLKGQVDLITAKLDFGDWKLVYHLLRNMNSETFAEFCGHLAEKFNCENVS